MKYLCLLAALLTVPVGANAQQRRNEDRRTSDRSSNERERSNDRRESNARERAADDRKPNRPTSGPLVPSWESNKSPWWERQGAPWWEGGARPNANRNNTNHNDSNRRDDEERYRGRRNYNSGVVYVVPGYPYMGEAPTTTPVTPPPPTAVIERVDAKPTPPPPAIGFLNLEVEPRAHLQVYVDEVFLGTPGDLGDELRLNAGTRRIELRAKGYKTLSFSAEIADGRSISYRGALERDPGVPVDAPAVRTPASSGPTTMYKIPGCYLGNIVPRASDLPPGCDLAKMTTFKP